MERKIAPKRSDPKKHTKKSQFDNMEVYRQLRTNIEYSSFNKDFIRASNCSINSRPF